MSASIYSNEVVSLLGEEKVAEIRRGVEDLLERVLANGGRYARETDTDDEE